MFEAPADALVYHDPAVNMEHLKHAGEANLILNSTTYQLTSLWNQVKIHIHICQ